MPNINQHSSTYDARLERALQSSQGVGERENRYEASKPRVTGPTSRIVRVAEKFVGCVTCRTLLTIPPRHVHARLSERTSPFVCYRYVQEGLLDVATLLVARQ
jgi:hypothetical protein